MSFFTWQCWPDWAFTSALRSPLQVEGGNPSMPAQQLLHFRCIRLEDHSALGDQARDQLRRCDVERRIANLHALRRPAYAPIAGDLVGWSFFDRDVRAVGDLRVEGGERGGDVERQ